MCFTTQDHYEELVDWMEKNERMPSSYSKDRIERRLGRYCERQKDKVGNKQRHFYEFQRFANLKYWNKYKY